MIFDKPTLELVDDNLALMPGELIGGRGYKRPRAGLATTPRFHKTYRLCCLTARCSPDRPVNRWMACIPEVYAEVVLDQSVADELTMDNDLNCLFLLKHYRSLVPLAQEVRKPIFALKPGDGTIGSHFQAAQSAFKDFKSLTEKILSRLILPDHHSEFTPLGRRA